MICNFKQRLEMCPNNMSDRDQAVFFQNLLLNRRWSKISLYSS